MEMIVKECNYRNNIGRLKKIVIYAKEDGKYPFELWDMQSCEFCGSGDMTREEMNEFFEHYGISERV